MVSMENNSGFYNGVKKDLAHKIKQFDSMGRIQYESVINEAESDVAKFVKRYPIDILSTLTLEEYLFSKKGDGNADTFCCHLQNDVRNSSMKTCYPAFYGIYMVGGKVHLNSTLTAMGFTDNTSAFKWQINEIIDLLNAGKKHDLESIEKNKVNSLVKNKLLSIYYPDEYLPMNTMGYIETILDRLEIEYDKQESTIKKSERLLNWKKNQGITKEWTNHYFMLFCDHYFFFDSDGEDWKKKAEDIDQEIDDSGLVGESREALVKVRVNQGIFRERLFSRYDKCVLCGVNNSKLLIASHIKPWKDSLPEEKLDIDNGFLMCPNHDRLFDNGLISFSDKGEVLISHQLSEENRLYMNVNEKMKIEVTERNKMYLSFHRNIYGLQTN